MAHVRRDGYQGPAPRFTARIHVLLEPPQLEALDRLSRQRNTTRAQELRAALDRYLAVFGGTDTQNPAVGA